MGWNSPPKDWIKVNVDVSRRNTTRLASIGYIMRENQAHIIMAKGKCIGGCHILVVECVTAQEAMATIHKKLQKIFIESDSQLVINSINSKIRVSGDIIIW